MPNASENTERPITIAEGTNQLVGQDPVTIVNAAREILAAKSKRGKVPQFWDGHAAERIVNILLQRGEPKRAEVNAGGQGCGPHPTSLGKPT